MNIVIPNASETWLGIKRFFTGLGFIPTLLIIVAVVTLIWFAIGGLTDMFQSWNANRQIENLKNEADQLRLQRQQAESEKEQYKGAAAVYKQQAQEVQNELNELLTVRPDLQKRTQAASERVEEIRRQPVRPVTDDMRQRVDEFGAKLDKLYP